MRKLRLSIQDLEVRSFLTGTASGFLAEPVSDPQAPGDTAFCSPSRLFACTE